MLYNSGFDSILWYTLNHVSVYFLVGQHSILHLRHFLWGRCFHHTTTNRSLLQKRQWRNLGQYGQRSLLCHDWSLFPCWSWPQPVSGEHIYLLHGTQLKWKENKKKVLWTGTVLKCKKHYQHQKQWELKKTTAQWQEILQTYSRRWMLSSQLSSRTMVKCAIPDSGEFHSRRSWGCQWQSPCCRHSTPGCGHWGPCHVTGRQKMSSVETACLTCSLQWCYLQQQSAGKIKAQDSISTKIHIELRANDYIDCHPNAVCVNENKMFCLRVSAWFSGPGAHRWCGSQWQRMSK